jgi:signal transduction histidine kinase
MDNENRLKKENSKLKKELEAFRKNEKMFHALVETAVGYIGEEFFNNIVEKLSEWLNAECVIIGQVVRENVVEGFPLYLDGKIIHGFTYRLKGTPCDLTSKKGYCVFEDNVGDVYPNSKDITELNIKGYVGTALYNKKGQANGILCAMSRSKLQLPPQAEDILRIVGARITAEIDRIKSQKALQDSEEKLKIANASKDKLFSIISHDLRQPFNALLGFSNLLNTSIKANNKQKVLKFANIIQDVSNQTFILLNNLLEWSQTQTGTIILEPEDLNIKELIDSVVTSFQQILQNKNITLKYIVTPSSKLFADKNMLTIVFRNLISNSIKFSYHGGKIKITVSSNKKETTFSIADTGMGMKESDIKKLFKLEKHFTTKGTDNEKGSGLGLLLCKELVNKHDGKIWVESKPGTGTNIFFTIPVKQKEKT